jgi:hypothetical protein
MCNVQRPESVRSRITSVDSGSFRLHQLRGYQVATSVRQRCRPRCLRITAAELRGMVGNETIFDARCAFRLPVDGNPSGSLGRHLYAVDTFPRNTYGRMHEVEGQSGKEESLIGK